MSENPQHEKATHKEDPDAVVRITGGLTYNARGGYKPGEEFQEVLKKNPKVLGSYLDGAARAQQKDWESGNHPADKNEEETTL